MFNTLKWSKLSENSYCYATKLFSYKDFNIFYSHVLNDVGEYVIAPSFGDFINIPRNQCYFDEFYEEISRLPIKAKVCIAKKPKLVNFDVFESGFIHEVNFSSHSYWRDKIIKYKYRNKIVQAEKKGITTKIISDLDSLKEFYSMHSLLRINKFNEIPQPWKFFESIYNEYFPSKEGFLINAYDPDKNLIAGVLCLIYDGVLYYKYNASYKESLHYRPNNILMNDLIRYCERININTINLGFTGASKKYQGLRDYKLSSGAIEIPRYIVQSKSFNNLNIQKIKDINNKIQTLINKKYSLKTIEEFSGKYYKYFI